MARDFVMAIDAGGGGGHCLLVDAKSGAFTRAFRRWRHPGAPGTGGFGTDLDLALLWQCLGEAAREVRERAGVKGEEVCGVAVTGMRHTTIALDAGGEPILATANRDARAVGEALELAAQRGDELHSRTGQWPSPLASAARLRWLGTARPEAWERVAVVLSLSDWIASRLCGVIATDASQAASTLLLDVARRDWAPDLAESLGVGVRRLPEIRPSGSRLGALGAGAAAHLGLREGTAVAVGGGDTQCALLGVGIVSARKTALVAGTTAPVVTTVDAPRIDARRRLWTGCHVLPDLWTLEANAGLMGETLDWLARLLHPGSPRPVARFLAEAAGVPPASGGFLSTIGAGVMDPRKLELPVGTIALSHLASAGDPAARAHLQRAVVDGMACAVRANLELLSEVAGSAPAELFATGGMSRSRLFARALSDALGRPVRVGAAGEATGLGAAMCAAVGAGLFGDLAAAARVLAGAGESFAPDPERMRAHATLYAAWSKTRRTSAAAEAAAVEAILPAVLARRAAPPRPRPVVRPRVLVTAEMDEASLARLRALADVEHASFRKELRLLAGSALVEAAHGFQVLVTEIDVVDAAALAALPDLRVVVACRGHAVNVDADACSAFAVPVLHAPGRNAEAVADLAIAFLLMLARKLPQATAFLREPGMAAGDLGRMGQAFGALQGHELAGRIVGLVGFGAVGRAVAARLAGFGARVLAYDPHAASEIIECHDAEAAGLDELLEQSDFVSLHAAVTVETRAMIGAAELARMKPGAFLVNTARAALVDEAALLAALRDGRLAGAAFDVFAVEPPGSDHPLLQLENVIATPHVGGNTAEVAAHQGRIVVDDLARMLAGEPPVHALNPDVLARFDWTRPRPEPDGEALAQLAARPGPAVTDIQREPARAAGAAAMPASAPALPAATVERMERLLASFLAGVASDPAVCRFASGKRVMLRFTLTDLGRAFHLGLADGAVRAGLGDPPVRADVELGMRAAILDGMFTGALNPMEAAMGGRLSFSGDTVKAMTLRDLQGDLSRLYQAARAEIGAPGDLGPVTAPPRDGRPRASEIGPADVRSEIVRTVRELYADGLITATGGNVSARSPGNDGEVWITPAQVFKGDLRPEMLIRLDLEGRPLDEGVPSPSSESRMHCLVYQARPEARAVIHAHAPHATILVDAEIPFVPVSTEAAFFADLPRVPFLLPGSEDLARAVAAAMGESWAVLMKNHGLLVAGRSLRRAADMAEIIDRTAEIILGCHAVGRTPPALPDDVVRRLRQVGDLMA